MSEQWLAMLLVFGVIALSVYLSWITWKWFFRWQRSLEEEVADTAQDKENTSGLNCFRR